GNATGVQGIRQGCGEEQNPAVPVRLRDLREAVAPARDRAVMREQRSRGLQRDRVAFDVLGTGSPARILVYLEGQLGRRREDVEEDHANVARDALVLEPESVV